MRRIIPARAGFTALRVSDCELIPDHPRSRGVYRIVQSLMRHESGSSPLARGLRWLLSGAELQGRIIPARAGFTGTSGLTRYVRADHPRSRGVYALLLLGADESMGSSPLARGLLRGRGEEFARVGIIPARAGFTPRRPARWCHRGDHPRSRGVYARGDRLAGATGGIIPARAGFTDIRSSVSLC